MVTERLWIGSIHAAFNSASMQARGITHVSRGTKSDKSTRPRRSLYDCFAVHEGGHTSGAYCCNLRSQFIWPVESLTRFARRCDTPAVVRCFSGYVIYWRGRSEVEFQASAKVNMQRSSSGLHFWECRGLNCDLSLVGQECQYEVKTAASIPERRDCYP